MEKNRLMNITFKFLLKLMGIYYEIISDCKD